MDNTTLAVIAGALIGASATLISVLVQYWREDKKALIKAAKRISAKVNLIPLNTDFFNMKRPSVEKIDDFWRDLNKAGVVTINRKSPGLDIDAACGMLARNTQN